MAKYIDLEKLMAFPIRIDHYDEEHGNVDFVLGIECVLEYAQDLPTVDAVEVVRCGECWNRIHSNRTQCQGRRPWEFCSDGKREE